MSHSKVRNTLRVVTLLSVMVLMSGLEMSISSAARGQTQAEMNAMAARDYRKADAKLNVVYKQLKTALSGDKQKKQLTTAQLAWLKFRDTEAEFLASDSKGGTIWPTIYTGFLTQLTEQRTKALDDSYKGVNRAELSSSADTDYTTADARLNQIYKQLKSVLLDDKQKKQLTTAQLAWLKFRDTEAEFLTADRHGATIEQKVRTSFLTKLTEQRSKELEDSYKYFKQD